MSSSSDIDYLFEDFSVAEEVFPFEKLPAELRNNIYEQYIGVQFKDNIVQMSETGGLVLPPLFRVCKAIRHGTEGYLMQLLQIPSTKIHAQVRDYNPKPIVAAIESLTKILETSKAKILERTKVFLIGGLNYGNLWEWISQHMADREKMPIFAHDKARISGFDNISVFTGPQSLFQLIVMHDFITSINPSSWRNMARTFCDLIDEAGMKVLPRLQNPFAKPGNDEGLTTYVFKTVAHYQHAILKSHEKVGRKIGGKRTRDEISSEKSDMAQLLYMLTIDCEIALQ